MKDLRLYLVIGFSLLAFYLIAQYYKPKPTNWDVTLSKNDKIPFGTYVLYNRLHDLFPGSVVKYNRDAPYNTFTETDVNRGNYILIAQRIYIDEYDFEELRKYMEEGNNVFIAGFYLGAYLTDSLKLKVNSENKFDRNAKVPVHFVNAALDSTKKYTFNKGIGEQYFSRFDSSKAVVLGVNNKGHANYIKYNYGKGSLYLLASPMYFTNYNMLKPEGAEYAAKVLSYLPVMPEIIWDEFSSQGEYHGNDSPIRFFLTNKSLRWAYLISIFSLILFVLYNIKRRQRIIPTIAPLENTSAEFAKVIGQVYYHQHDNANISKKKITYFLEDVRAKYAIKTNSLNEEFAELLNAKSGVQRELINELLKQFLQIQSAIKVSDQQLISLNKNIEQFQHQSKS